MLNSGLNGENDYLRTEEYLTNFSTFIENYLQG